MADIAKILISIIVVIAVILNAGTFYLLASKAKKNQYMIICLHIAVSDLIQTLIGYIPEILLDLKDSDILCKGTAFIVAFSAFASLSLLTLISILKVFGINMPFRSEVLAKQKFFTHMVAASGWIYALAWAFPPLIGWSRFTLESTGKRCSIDWAPKSIAGKSYLWMLIVFAFVLPVIINIVGFRLTGSVISRFTKRCETMYGRSNLVTSLAKEREIKSLRTRVIMLLALLICWSPYAIVGVISGYADVPNWLLDVAAVFAKSSAMFNPLIYCHRIKWKNTRRTLRDTMNKSLSWP